MPKLSASNLKTPKSSDHSEVANGYRKSLASNRHGAITALSHPLSSSKAKGSKSGGKFLMSSDLFANIKDSGASHSRSSSGLLIADPIKSIRQTQTSSQVQGASSPIKGRPAALALSDVAKVPKEQSLVPKGEAAVAKYALKTDDSFTAKPRDGMSRGKSREAEKERKLAPDVDGNGGVNDMLSVLDFVQEVVDNSKEEFAASKQLPSFEERGKLSAMMTDVGMSPTALKAKTMMKSKSDTGAGLEEDIQRLQQRRIQLEADAIKLPNGLYEDPVIRSQQPLHTDARKPPLDLSIRSQAYFQQKAIKSLRKGEFSVAFRELSAAIELSNSPQSKHRSMYAMGCLARDTGDHKSAARLFEASIESDPRNAWGYFGLGSERLKLGDLQAAITQLTKAIELDPTQADFYINRGHCYRHLRNYKAATKDYSHGSAVKARAKLKHELEIASGAVVSSSFAGDEEEPVVESKGHSRASSRKGRRRSLTSSRNGSRRSSVSSRKGSRPGSSSSAVSGGGDDQHDSMRLKTMALRNAMRMKPSERQEVDVSLILGAIESSPFFKLHPQRVKREMAKKVLLIEIPKGELLMTEEETCSDLYFVHRGIMKLSRSSDIPETDNPESESQEWQGSSMNSTDASFPSGLSKAQMADAVTIPNAEKIVGSGAVFGDFDSVLPHIKRMSDLAKTSIDRVIGNDATTLRPVEIWPSMAVAEEETSILVIRTDEYCRILDQHREREVAEKRNFFIKNPFFENWDGEAVERVCRVVQMQSYGADEAVLKQGEGVPGLFFVNKGSLKVYRTLTYDPSKSSNTAAMSYGTQMHSKLGFSAPMSSSKLAENRKKAPTTYWKAVVERILRRAEKEHNAVKAMIHRHRDKTAELLLPDPDLESDGDDGSVYSSGEVSEPSEPSLLKGPRTSHCEDLTFSEDDKGLMQAAQEEGLSLSALGPMTQQQREGFKSFLQEAIKEEKHASEQRQLLIAYNVTRLKSLKGILGDLKALDECLYNLKVLSTRHSNPSAKGPKNKKILSSVQVSSAKDALQLPAINKYVNKIPPPSSESASRSSTPFGSRPSSRGSTSSAGDSRSSLSRTAHRFGEIVADAYETAAEKRASGDSDSDSSSSISNLGSRPATRSSLRSVKVRTIESFTEEVASFSPGDWFGGECLLVHGGLPSFCTVKASENCELYYIDLMYTYYLFIVHTHQTIKQSFKDWVKSLPSSVRRRHGWSMRKQAIIADRMTKRD